MASLCAGSRAAARLWSHGRLDDAARPAAASCGSLLAPLPSLSVGCSPPRPRGGAPARLPPPPCCRTLARRLAPACGALTLPAGGRHRPPAGLGASGAAPRASTVPREGRDSLPSTATLPTWSLLKPGAAFPPQPPLPGALRRLSAALRRLPRPGASQACLTSRSGFSQGWVPRPRPSVRSAPAGPPSLPARVPDPCTQFLAVVARCLRWSMVLATALGQPFLAARPGVSVFFFFWAPRRLGHPLRRPHLAPRPATRA